MVRKLIKPLLSMMMMAPAAALALGLGEVKLHSALNQNLNADIELLSVEPGDVEELEVSLASAETFAKLGLNRPSVLMFVQFETKQGKDGKYYVHATSKDAIREPFLDFLVEAKWPAGRVLREYTLLLDPPTRHAEMAAPVNAATTSMGGGQPMASTPAPQQAPMAPSQGAVSAPMPQQESVTYYPQPQPQQQTAAPGGVSYGPVRAGDTLWQIALKVRPNSNISASQMMMALLKANPHAFIDNNVNRLKKGFVLRVDDPALYTAMSKAEAARAISQQTREWQDYREAVAAKAGERQSATADTGTSRSTASGKSEPKLTLVAPNGKQKGAGAGGDAADGDMQEQLMLALESSAAQRKDNEELQGRVDDLEAQLQDMQRLLALKDSDMATLQKQLREQGTAVTLPSEQAAQPKPEAAAAPEAKPEEKPAAPAVAPVTEEQPKAEATKPAETTAPAAPAKPAQKPKPKPRVMPQPQPEPSFIDMLLGDQLMLMAGGGVIVLLLLLGLVISRRRGKGGFQESILSGGTSSMLNTGSDESRSETSFLSDLAISGMGGGSISADEGEVDPITEADVFMAYGRYQQAEEVLKKALEAHPDRPDVIGKLFEVYFNTREKDKFDELVDSSAAAVQGNDSIWPSVAAMGQQISPENPLFAVAEASAAPSAPAPRPEPITEDVLDIGLDLDELSAEMESDADTSDSLDLGLDLGDLDSSPATKTASTQEAAASDLDFDLDFGDDSATAAPAASSDMGDLDFDLGELDAGDEAGPSAAETVAESAELELDSSALTDMQDDGLGDLDLGDLDFGDLGGSSPAAEEPAEVSLDLSELDSGDDFGELTSDTSSSADDDVFGDGDEISTKLDLAQAYIEMGDGEGARSMLDEVVVQGNAKQKQQAEALLSRI